MPVGFNSPARNLFLLGSSGQQVVTNFFETIDKSSTTDGVFIPDEIRYIADNKKYALAGSASDSNSKSFGWLERQDYNLETGGLTTDYSNRIESTQSGVNTTLRAMELDDNNNLIVVGKTDTVPWIAKYSNDGVLDWSSTTNSADVSYLDVASDSNGKYYACGRTPLTATGATDTQAFVESFDENGNPGWGKQAYMLGREVTARAIDANDRGHVVAAGFLEDDTRDKGYIIKINTATGEVMWDRTLTNPDGDMRCTDVFIDSKDQIYVIGNDSTHGYLLKYSAEGNMIWQKKTNQSSGTLINLRVQSDGETEQTIVFGRYEINGDQSGILSKYAKDGRLVFRRMMTSSNNNSDTFSSLCLDADPSFYYFMYTDQAFDGLAGTPDRYTFGKVSSSGNGLGDFQYTEGTGTTIDYEILNEGDVIGRLSDGSVRNDTSDLIAYPFNANKLLFDDLATQVTNKRRQMDDAGSFEYSGSPAIRTADFQELNLLGDEIRTEVTTGGSGGVDVSSESKITTSDGASNDRFGWTVAVGNNKIVSGASLHDFAPDSNQGAVYVYDLDGTNEVKISASDKAQTDNFGYSVAVGSNRIVVGALNGDGNVSNSGAAYIYNLDGTNEVKITASDGAGSDRYGSSVAVGDDKVVVGAYLTDVGANANQGTVYVYDLDGTNEVKINASDAAGGGDSFGWSVAVGESKIVVGAASDDVTATNAGAVYVYDLDGSNELKITPSDATSGDNFGTAVSIGHNKIVVGAYNGDGNVSGSGAAYIYNLDGTGEVKITASDGEALDRYGQSVAIGNNKIVVGANREHGNGGTDVGAIYVYDLDGTNEVKINASDATDNEYFGNSVGIGHNKIVVGERSLTDAGAVYVYSISGGTTTSTFWVDQSGKGNDGVVNGATLNAAEYWEFDGVDDGITIPYTPKLAFTDAILSLEAWIYVDDLTNAFPIINKRDDFANDNTNRPYILEVNSSGRLRFSLDFPDGGPFTTICETSTGAIVTGQWYHVAGVHDGTTSKLYINGSESASVASGTTSLENTGDVPTRIGYRYTGSSIVYGDGRIGEVRIYPRAVTAAQVFQNYNATKTKYINEAPDVAPNISDSSIVYNSNLILNYDFRNRGTYDPVENLLKDNFTNGTDTEEYYTDELGVKHTIYSKTANLNQYFGQTAVFSSGTYDLVASMYVDLTDATNFYVRPENFNGSPATATVVESDIPALGSKGMMKVRYTNVQPTQSWVFAVRGVGDAKFARPFVELKSDHGRYVKTYETAIPAPTTVKNLSSSSYPGTINGATLSDDGSFYFGNNHDITSSLNWTPANQFSFTMWFRLDQLKDFQSLVDLFNSTSFRNFQLFVESDGDLRVYWGNTSGTSAITSTAATTWYYAAFSCNGETGTLYRYGNGIAAFTDVTASAGSYSVKPLVLGKRGDDDANSFLDGKIGEFQFYNTELSTAQIVQNYNATRTKYGV